MKLKFSLLIILFLASLPTLKAQQIQKTRTGTFALTNATIETITNGTVAQGTLVIANGKIAALGTNVTIPDSAEVIDCTGLTLYPGMIDAGTRIGLSEVGSVEETTDYNEVGDVNPQVEALTAVNPNSVLIPVTRVSGVTTALTLPTGGLFPGKAALLNLHGYTPRQMYAGFVGVVLNWPSAAKRGYGDKRSPEAIKKEYEKEKERLNSVWEKALTYAKIDSAYARDAENQPEYYPEMMALSPVVSGKAPLLLEVNMASEILDALTWIKEKNLKKVVLTGVMEGWRVADKIKAAGVSVITGPVLQTPTRDYDRYDKPYANAGLLAQAGIPVAIRTLETENARNLPYHAGFAAAYGMGKEEALKAITIVSAQILGVADALGSLETGKQATLFAATGDPFETSTDIRYVFINGWLIPMDSRQIRLYDEFLEREPGLSNE